MTSLDRTRARAWLGAASSILLAAAWPRAAEAVVEPFTVTIDATSDQPVGTGIIPANDDGEIIVFSEGAIRSSFSTNGLDDGWFGPAGKTRLTNASSPVVPIAFGTLIGGFVPSMTNYRHVGRMGSFRLDPFMVGKEFRVALNMSDAHLAGLAANVTVSGLLVPDGDADVAEVVFDASSALEVGTGLTGFEGDLFVVLPYGMLSNLPLARLTSGLFGPEGLPVFNRAGQPSPEGPYGGLYGAFRSSVWFYVGDGGCFVTDAASNGRQFKVRLNMSAADLATVDGEMIVRIVRIPLAAIPRTMAPLESSHGTEEIR